MKAVPQAVNMFSFRCMTFYKVVWEEFITVRQIHLSSIDCCSVSCADSTPEETDFVQRGCRVDLSHSYLVHHSVLREGTGSHKLQHLLALTGEPGLCTCHCTRIFNSPEQIICWSEKTTWDKILQYDMSDMPWNEKTSIQTGCSVSPSGITTDIPGTMTVETQRIKWLNEIQR